MAPFLLLIALAAPAPNADLESICRSVRSNALPDEKASAFENCVNEEREAQQKVQKQWTKVSPNARADCAPLAGMPFSYVAVLTCLNMQPGGDFDPAKTR